MPDTQPALFPDLPHDPPPPPLDGGIQIGTRRGDLEALHAAARKVEVWCGPALGWRPYGDPVGTSDCLVMAYGRLLGGPTFELAPAPAPPPEEEDDARED